LSPTGEHIGVRILLVKPKARLRSIRGVNGFQLLEPLELGYLAAVVPPEHEVRVLDLRLRRFAGRAFTTALRRFRPDLVGLTAYTHEGSIVKELVRAARRELPAARIVVGGHHATVDPADLEMEEIDAIVRGEGCAPFRAIVDRVEAGRDLEGIEGVLVPGGYGFAGDEFEWPPFPDPAELPLPRRDLWDARRYFSAWVGEELPDWHPILPMVSMVRTSWGCRMKCSFCIVPFLCRGEHRPRPVQSVVDEVASVPADHVYFSDDENFLDEEFALELALALKARGVDKRYFAWARSTTVNRSPELFRTWREVGLDAAFLGFEFPTDAELKQATKGGTVRGNERALERLRSMGIAVHAGFMVLPEYTEAQFRTLREYVRSLPPLECSFTVCTPSPGTPDYEAMRDRIWIDNPHDLHDCMHPLTPTTLPLKRFSRLFAEQAVEGTRRTPARVRRRPVPPVDLARIVLAERRYYRGFASMYREYPRALWGGPVVSSDGVGRSHGAPGAGSFATAVHRRPRRLTGPRASSSLVPGMGESTAINVEQARLVLSGAVMDPPRWVERLMGGQRVDWEPATVDVATRTIGADGLALVSAFVRDAADLDADRLASRTRAAYELIGERVGTAAGCYPVRVWNFMPGILEPLGELQHRYMAFNAGRYRAYTSWFDGCDRFDRRVPTASGVGHHGRDLVIHCLSSREAGRPVENPRQVSSYRYSERWGPLPPCFARATRVHLPTSNHPWLLVGGTASVRGEETVHPDDLLRQAEETFQNLASLVCAGFDGEPPGGDSGEGLLRLFRYLRVYVVDLDHAATVERLVRERFTGVQDIEFLQADLCRARLLVEIEGVAALDPRG
jgi:radical SAM superfamily enzyme YgiQ (UPF0313 family)